MDRQGGGGNWGERTRLVHAGRDPSEQFGFVNTPIYRGSTVLYPSYDALVSKDNRYTYATKGTPTTEALEKAWTDISGAAGTALAPSGLSAIALAMMSVAKTGDHVLVTDSVYRPTREILCRASGAVRHRDDLLRSPDRRRHRRSHP